MNSYLPKFQSLKLVFREWWRRPIFPLLYILGFAFSFGSYLVLDSFQVSVNKYLSNNQQSTVGGDIVIKSRTKLPTSLIETTEKYLQSIEYEFSSIISTKKESILAQIKSIGDNYPLYGEVELGSGKFFGDVFMPGTIIVDPGLLDRLNIKVGEYLRVGSASLLITDTLIFEPDRPLTSFSIGIRALVHNDDKAKIALIGNRSRVQYNVKLKLPKLEQDKVLEELKSQFGSPELTIKKTSEIQTPFSLFTKNISLLLKIIVLSLMILSIIGSGAIITTFLRNHYSSIAVRQNIGEKMQEITGSYHILFALYTIISLLVSFIFAFFVLLIIKSNFAHLFPKDFIFQIRFISFTKSLLIALLTTGFFSSFLLEKIRNIKPIQIFHKQVSSFSFSKKMSAVYVLFAVLLFLIWIFYEIRQGLVGIYIGAGLLVILLSLYGITRFIVYLISKFTSKGPLILRLAIKNLTRKSHQTTLFVIIVTLTFFIIGIIYLLSYNLNQKFVTTYPPEAPNMFFLDITNEQRDSFSEKINLESKLKFYPVVRGKIAFINDTPLKELNNRQRTFGDRVDRTFNLSYSEKINENERLLESVSQKKLFNEKPTNNLVAQFSILDEIRQKLKVNIGDQITFLVQGVEIKAEITSVRKRVEQGPTPYFYFIFRPQDLVDAPQILFGTTKLIDGQRSVIQNKVARLFPNITTIDVAKVTAKISDLISQLTQVITFFTSLGIMTGFILFFSSLVSTSQDRIRESVYFRLMGMNKTLVYMFSAIEFFVLGLLALTFGTVISLISTYFILNNLFNISMIIPWQEISTGASIFLVIVIGVGLAYTKKVIMMKPVKFLRKYNE